MHKYTVPPPQVLDAIYDKHKYITFKPCVPVDINFNDSRRYNNLQLLIERSTTSIPTAATATGSSESETLKDGGDILETLNELQDGDTTEELIYNAYVAADEPYINPEYWLLRCNEIEELDWFETWF